MSGRFFGKWPTDKFGNPIPVKVAASPYAGEPHKLALSRWGRKSKSEKPLSPLTAEMEIGATRDFSTSRA